MSYRRRVVIKALPIALLSLPLVDTKALASWQPLQRGRGAGAPTQVNWRWCSKCQGLWFNGNAEKGPCPAGGSHAAAGSSDYGLAQDRPFPGSQGEWAWCQKCQGLWFNGNPTKGACPAGAVHASRGSSSYFIAQESANVGTQNNWRWCRKCEGLWFAGNPSKGFCPAGGGHDGEGSSDYRLVQVA